MRWYRAIIRGDGVMFDGAMLPDTKTIYYDFQAENDEDAGQKADAFAHSAETRREFWLTDCNPTVEIVTFISNPPIEERAWLAS